MITIQDNIPVVIASLSQKERALSNLKPTLDKLQFEYIPIAKEIVLHVVYIAPENPAFPRSYNLLNSVDTDRPDDTIRIFLNPSNATAPTKFPGLRSYYDLTGKGGFTFYPSYVRRGIFFKKQLPERDFVAGWLDKFSQRFPDDIQKSVNKAIAS